MYCSLPGHLWTPRAGSDPRDSQGGVWTSLRVHTCVHVHSPHSTSSSTRDDIRGRFPSEVCTPISTRDTSEPPLGRRSGSESMKEEHYPFMDTVSGTRMLYILLPISIRKRKFSHTAFVKEFGLQSCQKDRRGP